MNEEANLFDSRDRQPTSLSNFVSPERREEKQRTGRSPAS